MAERDTSSQTLPRLSTAITEARARGWSTCDVSVDEALELARALDVAVCPTRRDEGPIAVLRPTAKADAHPRSLSARYGLDVLPLHTDGANHLSPPTVVLLEATVPCRGSTLIHPVCLKFLSPRQRESIRSGVFLVGSGRSAFYSHALDTAGRVRFDPGCMHPVDPAARYVSDWLIQSAEGAQRHDWGQSGVTVVIDNTRSLHGRSNVADHPDREIRRLMLHWNRDDDAM